MLRRSAKRVIDQRLPDQFGVLGQLFSLDLSDSPSQASSIEQPKCTSYRYWRCPQSQEYHTVAPLGVLPSTTAPSFASSSTTLPTQQHRFMQKSSFNDLPPPPPPPPLPIWMQKLPPSWHPYLLLSRLDKPIGTWLLLWPCLWSIALAAPAGSLPDLKTTALFTAGSVLLRGAGCTVNDLWDRELDAKVERTKTRPLASGAVSPPQAIAWLGAQLTAGLGILLQLNTFAQLVGASSLALVATYPLMKRITGWPQAFLGLTFNWGIPFGWAAVQGSCDWSVVLPMYFGSVCWTLIYDTIYAHQDKADDVAVGIKSTALTFGDKSKKYFTGFALSQTALFALAGYAAGCGEAYYAGVATGAAHLAWQIGTVDLDNGVDCAKKFVSNKYYGALIFSGILADKLGFLY